jgi:hypothetical protein
MGQSDVQRREKVTNRRKESGLKEVKLYLNPKTVEGLKQLASNTGYIDKLTNEDLSKVIESLIRQETPANAQLIGKRSNTQYLIFLHEVVLHQQKSGSSINQIVNFLEENYKLPPAFWKSKDQWNTSHVKQLIDEQWLSSKVDNIEQKHKERKLKSMNKPQKRSKLI